MRTPLLMSFLAVSLVLAAGCCSNPCRQPRPAPCPPPGCPPGGVVAPPGTLPAPPPGSFVPPGQPAPVAPPPGGFSQGSNFTPAPPWAPGAPPDDGAQAKLGPPQLDEPPGAGAQARLSPPQIDERTDAAPAVAQQPQQPAPPPPQAKEAASPFPVGIPQFAQASERVSAGLRPMLDDGLDWLQVNGYRTVLHLRRPGEESSADRKQIEKRGMKYLTLEVSPEGLTKEVTGEFSRVVGDSTGYPLFVYDRDGALAGALWYVHFRNAEGMDEEAARVRAAGLGLREDRDGAHRDMWQAARGLLSKT